MGDRSSTRPASTCASRATGRSTSASMRADRIWRCDALDEQFTGQGCALLRLWREMNPWEGEAEDDDAERDHAIRRSA